VSGRRPTQHGPVKKPRTEAAAPAAPSKDQTPPLAGIPITPLNTVTQSATRLGLPIIETPATVEVVNQRTMEMQGYRTTTDTAQGAVGVLAGDSAGAPANFSMRGFAGPQVNVLYNGIWTGPADITSRWMDTAKPRSSGVSQRPVVLDVGIERDRWLGQLRIAPADERTNQE
jgi:iron complex outermembrane receptor protein